MLCSSCKKNPANSYTFKRNGKEIHLDLCPACYEALYGRKDDFFTSFLEGTKAVSKPCPACGTTMEEFRKTGLLGCAYCYEAFRSELASTVRYIQGSSIHTGNPPLVAASDERYDALRDLVNQRTVLRDRLDKAVREKRYADADAIQEQLKDINHKLYRKETSGA